MQEQSRLGLLIGPDYEGNGKSWGQFEVHFLQNKANEQLEKLKLLAGGQLDLEWSVVLGLTALPGQTNKLAQGIQKFYETVIKDGSEDLTVKTAIGDNVVYVSIKGSPDVEADYMEPFNMFFNQGLEQISTQQQNQITGSLSSNVSFLEILAAMQNGERILSALLKSFKLVLNASLHSDLANKLRDLLQNFDPEFANEPPVMLFKQFKNFDIDLKFKGTEELPETIKNKVTFSFINETLGFVRKMEPEERALPMEHEKAPVEVFEAIGDEHEIWATIPNFVAFNMKVKTPGFSSFIKEYGQGLMDEF